MTQMQGSRSTHGERMPLLDGIRALAIGGVFLYHLAPQMVPGGFYGVDVFFVLSGFLITHLLLREIDSTGDISIRRFYARRLLRTVPVYLALLAVVAPITASSGNRLPQLILAATYSMNIAEARGLVTVTSLGVVWSLCIEEQFYLLWPAALRLLHRRSRRLFLVVATMAATSLGLAVALALAGASWQRIYFGTDTRAFELLIGCLLAIALHAREAPLPASLTRWGYVPFVVATPLLALTVRITDPVSLVLGQVVVVGATTLLILSSVGRGSPTLRLALGNPVMRWAGRISYSFYLVHTLGYELTFHLVHTRRSLSFALVMLGSSLALAAAAHYTIEVPFMRLKARFSTPSPTPEMLVPYQRVLRPQRVALRRAAAGKSGT
jgi:peptidoglycan/LPS O-acetylase OafA/YrhL